MDKYCILDDEKSIVSPHHYPNLVWIERGVFRFDIDYYEQAMDILTDSNW